MAKMIKLEKRTLDTKPVFPAVFDNAAADEFNVEERGQPFTLQIRYMSDAEYQTRIQKKAEIREKGVSRKIAATTSLDQLADLQTKNIIEGWTMPLDRFNLTVPLDDEVIAPHLNDDGLIDPEVNIEFDHDVCARFLKSNWGYCNFVQERSSSAYEANAKRERKAATNLPDASGTA